MIVVIPQHICCFISTKTEIPHDYGAPRSAGAAARLRGRFLWVSAPRRAGRYTSGATAGPSFAGISVDGLTVTSNSSEVAAVPAGSA
jgi:hypothetical protein